MGEDRVLHIGTGGQTGIRLREALARGDADGATALVPALDEAHRVELLLGAALRDARDDHARARLYLRADDDGDWAALCAALCDGAPDRTLDILASAYVAARRVPERWRPGGLPLDRPVRVELPDVAVAAALVAGVGGLALLDAFADLPLHAPVSHYYRRGTLHALGHRPLLILAASGGP